MTQIKPRPVTPLDILVEQLDRTLELRRLANIPDSQMESLINASQLAKGLNPYLSNFSTPESKYLAELAHKTASEDWSKLFTDGSTPIELEQEMLSGHIEGQMLKMFIHMMKAKTVLEVGMFTGYSALAMAEALPEDGKLIACEVDSYVAKFAQDCFSHSPDGHKIKVELAPALETMQKLADLGQTFDLVFIDAHKKEYIDYFNLLLDTNLLNPDGFIVVDNTLFQGEVYLPEEQRTANGQAIADFNRIVAEDDRVEQVILPLRDGITLIRRK